jgi:hypothetical protein
MARKKMGRVARDGAGLTQIQRRFLSQMLRDPKPLSVLLKERKVCAGTFAGWREEAGFERAFRRAAAALTRDALADLRFSFSLCGRIVSDEVMRIHSGEEEAADGKPAGQDTAVAGQATGVTAPATETPKVTEAKVAGKKKGRKSSKKEVKKRGALKGEEQRLCFEVIKVGMGAFVPKVLPRRRKRVFRRVDPVAFAELKRVQGEGAEVKRVEVE